MSYSNFIVLLARQRSGTNALRSVLDSHEDIHCFNEVFNFAARDSDDEQISAPNFFTFLERYGRERGVRELMPDRQELLFLDYLDYLRCFTDARQLVIDVKYNSTHFFTKTWQPMVSPFLFELIVKYRLRVLNVTRFNYIRYALSAQKARESGAYSSFQGEKEDRRVEVDIPLLLETLARCEEEDMLIRRHFAEYPFFAAHEYADLFTGDPSTVVEESVLSQIASWLGVENRFTNTSYFEKQSSFPLHDTIENFADVSEALTGTSFESCLVDEPIYRSLAGSTT